MLIIVHGIPGSGKTTLSKRLSTDLGIPRITQDEIKEFYADSLGTPIPDDESDAIGRAAKFAVIELASQLVANGNSLIIEGAFHADTATDAFAKIDMKHNTVIQIYVTCDYDVARQRFTDRIKAGQRHAVHVDSTYGKLTQQQLLHKYRALQLKNASVFMYDTTNDDMSYENLIRMLSIDKLSSNRSHKPIAARLRSERGGTA